MEVNATIVFQTDGQLTKNQLVKQFIANQAGGHCSVILDGQQVVVLREKEMKSLDQIRALAGNVSRDLAKQRVAAATIDSAQMELNWPAFAKEDAVTAFVEGWQLGAYQFTKYQSKNTVFQTKLHVTGDVAEAVKRGEIRAEAVAFSRDLMNEVSNVLNPQTFPNVITNHFAGTTVQVNVLGKKEIEEYDMQGVLTVCRGSQYDPSFVELTYQTDPSKPLVALVGKGVTYDSGGISLKSGKDLSDMRLDMGGAAAVCGAMSLLANSKAAANVVALIPIVENAPGPLAVMPGEVIHYKNGLIVQVGNTDAEGRLILADGLLRAGELGAEYIVDIATLTGAIVTALGTELGGVFGDEALSHQLKQIGDQNGDFVWPMPLIDAYEDSLDSDYADCKNISSMSDAGAITAGLFLRKFVPAHGKWLHVDMAGVMDKQTDKGYYTKSATGYGARLLADFVVSLEN